MNRGVAVFLLLCLVLGMSGLRPDVAAANASDITVIIDGYYRDFFPPPFISYGRTLVPMRAFFEAMDADVHWDPYYRVASGYRDGISVEIPIDSYVAYVDSEAYYLDVPAQIFQGRTFIPLRFVGEALGATVDWDQYTRTITVESYGGGTPSWDWFYLEAYPGYAFTYPTDWNVYLPEADTLQLVSPDGADFSIYDVASTAYGGAYIDLPDLLNDIRDHIISGGGSQLTEVQYRTLGTWPNAYDAYTFDAHYWLQGEKYTEQITVMQRDSQIFHLFSFSAPDYVFERQGHVADTILDSFELIF